MPGKASVLTLVLLLTAAAFAAGPAPQVFLWPHGAPGSEGVTEKEIDEPPNAQHGYYRITNVHNPSITVCLPPREKATGAAAIVCPGGAHRMLGPDPPAYDDCHQNQRNCQIEIPSPRFPEKSEWASIL